jgi:hypothetical protein
MTQITVTLDVDNSAFDNECPHNALDEIQSVLRNGVERITSSVYENGDGITIRLRDSNGNTCGTLTLTPRD